MRDVDEILPMAETDLLTRLMVPDRLAELCDSLDEPVPYSYLEVERSRFGWLQDPIGRVGTVQQLSDTIDVVEAPIHWTVKLRRRRAGWRVEKAHQWDSMAAARTAAGMEWSGAQGYLVDFHQGRPVIGPHIGDFEDPARYLDILRKRRGPS